MKTYIAGPMTGLPGHNYAAFSSLTQSLRAQGVDVLSPHEIDSGSMDRGWEWYMREALKMLLKCDSVLMLPGWQNSKGACLERSVAEALGMPIAEHMD